jgi:hypothetical protein
MEALILFVVLLALVAPVLAIVALVRGEGARSRVRALEDTLRTLEARLAALNRRLAQPPAAPEAAPVQPPPQPVAAEPRPPAPARPASAPAPVPVPVPIPVRTPLASPPVAGALALSTAPESLPPGEPPRAAPPPPRKDFATNLGPRILAATGALACIVFVALFVKYAWDNNLIPETGRVLLGGAAGIAMLWTGVWLLDGRYRPVGQGLSGAGLAALYVSVFGAHGFYDLIPRNLAMALMVLVTVCAVLIAAWRDARLLAALAWIGGYLTPVLLSTGEDKAGALFLYLALLDVGALVLDRRKPWPETAPLAALGTVLLYGGWFAKFYGPARFGTAAIGVVGFTALFALGQARKPRAEGMAAVVVLATIGTAILAGTDQPLWLMVMSGGLGVLAFTLAPRLGFVSGLLALFGLGAPFLVWAVEHYRPHSFGIAAAWVTGGLLMMLLRPLARVSQEQPEGDHAEAGAGLLVGCALAAAGLVSASMARSTDLPLGLSAFLLAQAGVAILARRRWAWAELTGAVGAALTTAVWLESYFKDGRQGDAWLIAFPAAGAYLLALVARGLIARREVLVADVFAHLANATLVWITLFYALYDTAPGALALASIGLAAVYLALGLAALRERPEAALQVRTALGLAAVFLTIAIPVRLGLHGITLAWAAEGVLLLGLGLRYPSKLARAGAYAVLALAAARLLVRHTPWVGPELFTPVLNPGFGTWLAVIAGLAAAGWLARRGGLEPDRLASLLLSIAALSLLFILVSGETMAAYDQTARLAYRRGDVLAGEQARLRGRFALSLVWTVYATSLLAGGLVGRSRALCYAGYALFAVTAAKVVLVDTATLQPLDRMLSFLVLGLLLMAGAFLSLRFRERLLPREAAS